MTTQIYNIKRNSLDESQTALIVFTFIELIFCLCEHQLHHYTCDVLFTCTPEICSSRQNGDCFCTACHFCKLHLYCNCISYLSSCTASALHCIGKKVETATASCRNSYCTNYTSHLSFLSRCFWKHSKNTIFWSTTIKIKLLIQLITLMWSNSVYLDRTALHFCCHFGDCICTAMQCSAVQTASCRSLLPNNYTL